jgi:cell division protein FtsB
VRRGPRPSAIGPRRIAIWAGIAALAYFAIEGGEYGTVALARQWLQARTARRVIDSLHHQVDSLARFKQAVLTDPATQERIAREEFGMIKAHEILYRFAAPADSGAHAPRP